MQSCVAIAVSHVDYMPHQSRGKLRESHQVVGNSGGLGRLSAGHSEPFQLHSVSAGELHRLHNGFNVLTLRNRKREFHCNCIKSRPTSSLLFAVLAPSLRWFFKIRQASRIFELSSNLQESAWHV